MHDSPVAPATPNIVTRQIRSATTFMQRDKISSGVFLCRTSCILPIPYLCIVLMSADKSSVVLVQVVITNGAV